MPASHLSWELHFASIEETSHLFKAMQDQQELPSNFLSVSIRVNPRFQVLLIASC
jgi:hypothetical protein